MKYPTDRELVKMMKSGDENAFTLLYNQYKPVMFKLAINKFQNRQEAEDIIQEIFISLWNRREKISVQTPVKHYLLRAVHLQFAQYCRHKVVTNKYIRQLEMERIGTINHLENKELSAQINKAIDKISAKACKKIFELIYIENQNCHTIASSLNITTQVVRNQTSRALKVIREELKKVI